MFSQEKNKIVNFIISATYVHTYIQRVTEINTLILTHQEQQLF
jgi:hypothetical protein